MCTFCSDLPSNERPGGRKSLIALYLKPNDPNNENEKYRFRILNFRSQGKNDRAYPFISRFVHNHWGINENGMRVVDECVVCPSTMYIDAKYDEKLGFTEIFKELKLKNQKPTWDQICPVCRREAEAWTAWKSSGKTDKLATERAGNLKRQFQGIVPVYVVNDPVNEKNNGRLKCIIFNNQDEYKQFIDIVNRERAKIAAEGNTYGWCNGTNAVDFYVRVEKVPVIYNEGKANEKRSFTRKITAMAFGRKPYDLVDKKGQEIITKDVIDKFEFDDQYYVKTTRSELEDFYKRHFAVSTVDVPDEDVDLFNGTSGSASVTKIPTNHVVAPSQQIPSDDSDVDKLPFDDGDDDDGDEDVIMPPDGDSKNSAQSVDALLDQLNFND